MNSIPPELWEAYERTEYRVGSVVLKAGEKAEGLNVGQKPWAYLTAWNPRSEAQPEDVNRKKQSELERRLRDEGFSFRPGVAHDPSGQWPDEEGVLAIGLNIDQALALGREFSQNAILVGAGDGPVHLMRC